MRGRAPLKFLFRFAINRQTSCLPEKPIHQNQLENSELKHGLHISLTEKKCKSVSRFFSMRIALQVKRIGCSGFARRRITLCSNRLRLVGTPFAGRKSRQFPHGPSATRADIRPSSRLSKLLYGRNKVTVRTYLFNSSSRTFSPK